MVLAGRRPRTVLGCLVARRYPVRPSGLGASSQIAVPPGSAGFRAGEVINYTVYQASGVVNSITAVLSLSVR